MSITKLNGSRLQRMLIAGANELHEKKQEVDAMNVFPVPDGDTGTNMSLTMLAAAKETQKKAALRVDTVANDAAMGALRGARGNSGVITSQLLRGFAKGLEGLEEADVKALASALEQSVKTAYKAVMKPKEGTILTVARACAEAAEQMAEKTEDLELFLQEVIQAGREMLNQTPDMLPVLKQAGVVDAGGRGLLYILEGARKHMCSEEALILNQRYEQGATARSMLTAMQPQEISFGYCTEFFIRVNQASDDQIEQLRAYLGTMGDSVICVSDADVIKVHVHTDHPGLVLEEALHLGSLSGLKIDNMREQHQSLLDFSTADSNIEMRQALSEKEIGFVSVSAGSGLTKIFQNLGVDEVIAGGQTMNPATEDILHAVERIDARDIFILPNNKNIILAAEQAAALCEEKTLHVIPTESIPQGINAMFCYGLGESPERLEEAMNEAIAAVTSATVTFAVRETVWNGQEIHTGDILGMRENQIAVIGTDVAQSAKDLLDQIVDENSEMVGIYYGAEVSEDEAAELEAYVEAKYPDCEVELQMGGQPLYYYIISVE